MFYIDKLLDGAVSVKDTKDGISEVLSIEELLQYIQENVFIFGYDKDTNTVNSIEYLPLNTLGNFISVATALESYKHDNKGLSEGEFVVRYMNNAEFRKSAYQVPLQNSRTSNKGTKEKTLVKRAQVEVQGHILESHNFEEFKKLVLTKGVFESGKYRFYDDWSILEYSEDTPNTVYWRVRMD